MDPVEVSHGAPLKRYVRVGPADVAYLDEGTGPALVLIHGFPTHGVLWRQVMAQLDADFRCVAPDLPGLGDTEVSPYADFSLPVHADLVVELLNRLEIDAAVLVGHDVGGGVAQIVAAQHPERVRALVLVDSVADDAWPVGPVARIQRLARIPALRAWGRFAAPAVARSRLGLNGGTWSPLGLPAEVVSEYVRPLRSAEGWTRFVRFLLALDARYTRQVDLSSIEVPALVVWGADDPFLPPRSGRRLADQLPNGRFRLLDWCGHWGPEERPLELADAIRTASLSAPQPRG